MSLKSPTPRKRGSPRTGRSKIYSVAVKKFGATEEFDDCFTGFLNKEVRSLQGKIECHHLSTLYFFDLHSMRFQIFREGDYMARLPINDPEPPTISIGKCDKID